MPDLPNPVELVAWGFRLPLESADDPRADAFVDAFVDASDARPRPGSSLRECASASRPTPPTAARPA